MGPWPLLPLRQAVQENDAETARQIVFDITAGTSGPPDLQWRESGAKLAIAAVGYCTPGPLRPPFVEVPAAVQERAEKRAADWRQLCDKYRPRVEVPAAV